MTTLLIKNGEVIDGTGNPAVFAHVWVEEDRIADVLSPDAVLPEADIEIDAAGCCVSPGFIDMHSHSDWVMTHPDHHIPLQCLVEQGVTTIVGGNCGFSPAPLTPILSGLLNETETNLMMDRPIDYQWASMADFLWRIEAASPLLNIAELVGHGAIRAGLTGMSPENLTDAQINQATDAIQKAFDEGACGLSFGLGYPPGMFSSAEEITACCKIAAQAGKPVTVHLKALSRLSPTYPPTYVTPHNIRALKEMIAIAQNTNARLQVSHLIFVGKNTWSTAGRSLRLIEDARRNGLDIMFDAFPYTFGNTTIDVVLPSWYIAMREKGKLKPWAKLLARAELRLGFLLLGFSYEDFQLMDGFIDDWASLNGRRIPDIAHRWGLSPFETVVRLSEKTRSNAAVLLHTYSGVPGNESVLDTVLSHPLCLFETDAITRFGGYPNPAAKGTFPKILGYHVRERRHFPIHEAISRMTGASAARFNLTDRGILARGKAADITIFDPAAISENRPAAPLQPAGRPRGIRHVFINGRHIVKNGAYINGTRAGRILR